MLDVRPSLRPLWFLSVALSFAACNGTEPKSQPLSLSFTTKSASPGAASGASADLQIGTGANSLTISQAQIVLAEIELSPNGSCSTTDEADDCDELEAAFNPPVTVGAGTSNLTIDVNLASWFTDATGAVIDPTNPDNAAAIEQNIQRSFRAFEDDNHDGTDDHDGGTGDSRTR